VSVLNGPGEGTWSAFALKVVEERDALRAEVARLRAVKAADLYVTLAADRDQWKARAEMFLAENERLRNEGNSNAIVAIKERQRAEAAEALLRELRDSFDWIRIYSEAGTVFFTAIQALDTIDNVLK
jgi:uncharacterized protein YktB (UPF0637 family)